MPAFDHLLHFAPLYQTRVWGGRRLETVFGRVLPDRQPYGESWELVDRAEHQSVVSAGPWEGTTLHELWTRHRAPVFGSHVRQPEAERFPILIKVLDCSDDLSIQVHPPAAVAPALGGEPKTEMWFIAHADRGSRIYAGLRPGVTKERFARALGEGTVAECVHALEPRSGESLFVPSGRVHALGGGLVVFEIQQNSDTTYRVFDWNRVGLDGRPRTLHVAESMACIDFSDVEPTLTPADAADLASCDYFRVTHRKTGDSAPTARGRLVMSVGRTHWGGEVLQPAELVLCPASLALPDPVGDWLEIEY